MFISIHIFNFHDYTKLEPQLNICNNFTRLLPLIFHHLRLSSIILLIIFWPIAHAVPLSSYPYYALYSSSFMCTDTNLLSVVLILQLPYPLLLSFWNLNFICRSLSLSFENSFRPNASSHCVFVYCCGFSSTTYPVDIFSLFTFSSCLILFWVLIFFLYVSTYCNVSLSYLQTYK